MIRTSLLAAATLALAGLAAADDFVATQSIEKIVTVSAPDGAVSLDYQSADQVSPGDTLYYHIDYENGSSEAADAVKLVMVVPAEVSYLENTADAGGMDAELAFSADNGQTFTTRRDVRVERDGVSQTASAGDITHIRWAFNEPVAPGNSGKVSFRATVR